jgi:hypothetical protein
MEVSVQSVSVQSVSVQLVSVQSVSVQSHTTAVLPEAKTFSVPTEWEGGWALHLVLTCWIRAKYPAARIRDPRSSSPHYPKLCSVCHQTKKEES